MATSSNWIPCQYRAEPEGEQTLPSQIRQAGFIKEGLVEHAWQPSARLGDVTVLEPKPVQPGADLQAY